MRFCRQIETALLPLILENNTARVEGAMPDEKVIGDNVLETLQPAQATTRHAARLDSNPEVCHDAIEQQEADAMAARLVYTDAEVMVELVAQADFKPTMLNLTGGPAVLCMLTMHHPLKLQNVVGHNFHDDFS